MASKIKIAASDLDGTLIGKSLTFPPDFWQTVDAMREKGIVFAVASGRSYSALKQVFQPYPEKVTFICDNGANVVQNGEVIYMDTIKIPEMQEMVRAMMDYNLTRPQGKELKLLLCGVHGTYHMDYGTEYAANIEQYYNNRVQVEDLSKVEDEIYKLAVYDPLNPQTDSHAKLSAMFPHLSFQVSGLYWMDVMNEGTDKGKALVMLMNKLGASREEAASFGDFYNDVSLFRETYYSYCMENGDEGVKKYANFVAPHVDDYGVTKVLRELCDLDF